MLRRRFPAFPLQWHCISNWPVIAIINAVAYWCRRPHHALPSAGAPQRTCGAKACGAAHAAGGGAQAGSQPAAALDDRLPRRLHWALHISQTRHLSLCRGAVADARPQVIFALPSAAAAALPCRCSVRRHTSVLQAAGPAASHQLPLCHPYPERRRRGQPGDHQDGGYDRCWIAGAGSAACSWGWVRTAGAGCSTAAALLCTRGAAEGLAALGLGCGGNHAAHI